MIADAADAHVNGIRCQRGSLPDDAVCVIATTGRYFSFSCCLCARRSVATRDARSSVCPRRWFRLGHVFLEAEAMGARQEQTLSLCPSPSLIVMTSRCTGLSVSSERRRLSNQSEKASRLGRTDTLDGSCYRMETCPQTTGSSQCRRWRWPFVDLSYTHGSTTDLAKVS